MALKHFKTACLLAALAALLCTAALAAPEDGEDADAAAEAAYDEAAVPRYAGEIEYDMDYAGRLDPYTGLPYSGESAAISDGTRVRLTDDMYYDRTESLFVYPFAGGLQELRCSVADGMIVSEPVSVSADEGVLVTVYRDGVEVDADAPLNTVGEYSVTASTGGYTGQILDFTIVGPRTSLIQSYPMPQEFYIRSATFDGEEIFFERYYADMAQEGAYTIQYTCPKTGLDYTLSTVIDRTPPTLDFFGRVDDNGYIRSALRFEGLGDGDTLFVERDGESFGVSIQAGAGSVSEPGRYVFTVMDSAGNSTTYDYTILLYFDLNSLVFFALTLSVLAGAIGYVIYQRRRLSVR